MVAKLSSEKELLCNPYGLYAEFEYAHNQLTCVDWQRGYLDTATLSFCQMLRAVASLRV